MNINIIIYVSYSPYAFSYKKPNPNLMEYRNDSFVFRDVIFEVLLYLDIFKQYWLKLFKLATLLQYEVHHTFFKT